MSDTSIRALKIDLPETPIDEFEIRYFTVECERVQEVVLKYHINSEWADVCPQSDRTGAAFVDDWQYIVDGRFEGRSVGWLTPSTIDRKGCFANREDAVLALQNKLKASAEYHAKRMQEYLEKAALVG